MLHKSKIESTIVLLEIDNPPANSLSKRTKVQLVTALDEIRKDPQVRVVIITGRGEKFCSGDDLKEAVQNASKEGGILNNLKEFGPIMDSIESLPIPVIAAINGWCIGGGLELALCCDIRMAAHRAKFITAGVNVGLTASAYRLPRLIGIGRAKRMLLTGQVIDAQQAKEFGLVSDLMEAEELLPAALELAKVIANKAPLAIRATKRIANVALDLSEEEGIELQANEIKKLALSRDHQEALAAFTGKRTPIFKGE